MKQIILILCAFLSAVGCSQGEEIMNLDGYLLFGGQGIYALNLSNGETEVLSSLGSLSIDDISVVSQGEYLISFFDLQPTVHRRRIALYKADSDEFDVLLDGSRAVYFESQGKIVFYNNEGKLAITDIDNLANSTVINRYPVAYPTAVVPISERSFVYEEVRNDVYSVWKYSIVEKTARELERLKSCSLSRAVWKASSSELLCSERRPDGVLTGGYFLVDLQGSKREIDFGEGEVWPAVYIESVDGVIVQGRAANRIGMEQYPVYLYSFVDGSRGKIADDVLLSRTVTYVGQ